MIIMVWFNRNLHPNVESFSYLYIVTRILTYYYFVYDLQPFYF